MSQVAIGPLGQPSGLGLALARSAAVYPSELGPLLELSFAQADATGVDLRGLAALARPGAIDSFEAMLAAGSPTFAAHLALGQLRSRRGLAVAQARAMAAETLLLGLWRALGPQDRGQLLLRGSLAQGLVSCRSDVDFEISGPEGAPDRYLALEQRICTVVGMSAISAEGSAGRPSEKDLVGEGGLARDLHEWSELRQAGNPLRDVGWLAEPFRVAGAGWWWRRSAYERIGRQPTAKYAFFEARALIARTAAREGLGFGRTMDQLAALRDRTCAVNHAALVDVLTEALDLYESGERGSSVAGLQLRLAGLRRGMGLPGPRLLRRPGVDPRGHAEGA